MREGGRRYEAKARVMEKGYSLKRFLVASLVEAFLRAGGHDERMFIFGSDRLVGSGEALWKADRHLGRSYNVERRELLLIARGHALQNIMKFSSCSVRT